jgi:hypothetical protein
VPLQGELHGQVVHFTATGHDVQGSTADRSFGVLVRGALHLRRRTEYCQWSQAQSLSCEQCEVEDDDGNVRRESCNCQVCVGVHDLGSGASSPRLRGWGWVAVSPRRRGG